MGQLAFPMRSFCICLPSFYYVRTLTKERVFFLFLSIRWNVVKAEFGLLYIPFEDLCRFSK